MSTLKRLIVFLLSFAIVAVAAGCSTSKSHVKIALIDDGIAALEQFQGYQIYAKGENSASDHGTMMLSTILGVAGGEPLDSSTVSILSYDVGGTPSASHLAAVIERAIEEEPDVINISLGVRRPSAALEQAVVAAEAAGIRVVAATGNVRSLAPDYPARYDSVLSVAAADDRGQCWQGSPCDKADTVELGVNVSVFNASGKMMKESGSSIAAARVSKLYVEQLLDGRISESADFEPAKAK